MTWKICHWRFVQSGTRIYVDGVGDVLGCFRRICNRRMYRFILACRCKKQATIRCEGETSEERCKCLIGVDGGVPDSKIAHSAKGTKAADARRVWHHSWERH
jgi:hypothetical protein